MDAGTVTGPAVLEMALGNARQHRDDMVLWLALQVMMTDAWRWPTTPSRTG